LFAGGVVHPLEAATPKLPAQYPGAILLGRNGAVSFVFEHETGIDMVCGLNIRGVYLAALHSTQYISKLADLLHDACGLTAQRS
jgi:hypothetical protein